MDELDFARWLDALEEQRLIGEWKWDLDVQPGEPAAVSYLIDGRPYTHTGAVKLVRDFEAAALRSVG